MFNFLKKVVSSVLPWGSELSLVDAGDDERTILNRINSINVQRAGSWEIPTGRVQPVGQSEPVQYNVETFKCIHKSGKVTSLREDYGVIDDVLYFEPSQVSVNVRVKEGDEVLYSAIKLKENEADRVYKVYALKNDPSDFEYSPEKESSVLQETEELTAFQRVITGRVTQRKGREVYIESVDLWCSLDKIKASFVPVEGDWVELQAVVTVDEEAVNLGGDVIEVVSLQPLLTKSGSGRITFWSDGKREGAIENHIYFTSYSCENGYRPSLGDEVEYDAVESDQERFRWRALKVTCKSLKSSLDATGCKNNISHEQHIDDLMCDKNDISITPSLCTVDLELNEVKTVLLEVTNSGKAAQILVRADFLRKKTGQVKLVSPRETRSLCIQPKKTVMFQFECEGKVLGIVGEMFYFYFKNFVIAKRFEINVTGNREMNKLLDCRFDTVFKVYEDKRVTINEQNNRVVLSGPRPWTPPKFVAKERSCVFNIPKTLLNLMGQSPPPRNLTQSLLRYAPYLKEKLDFCHYADRFHTLLYLEEISLRLNFKKYDMKGVYLQRQDDFFVLEVPGLVEKRPSIIFGDKIMLTQPWSEGNNTTLIGYVYDIREKEVFVKFASFFHDRYDETECDISFEPNVHFFSKAHEAVNRAVRSLGEQWLFPAAVNLKVPVLDFVVSDQDQSLPDTVDVFFQQISKNNLRQCPLPLSPTVTEVEKASTHQVLDVPEKKKTLTWFNKKLNDRQKLAVVNVLKNQGRPLPYIIFGPPGTGKTVTLVEAIVQVYRLMPESRILITTPSNSAADLITERLIDLDCFKPGQMVRLYALYRVHDGLVPAKLIPYSCYYSPKDCPRKPCWTKCCRTRIQKFSMEDVIGRHRITIATCVGIGFLHYRGLPAGHFTHIMVDEAGQTSEPEVLISATLQNLQTGQLVLTGDPQQLGPVISSRYAKSYGLGVSLLQRLISRFPYQKDPESFQETSGFDPRFITQLNVNYRSVPEILNLSSQMFYNSDLVPTVSQTDGPEADIIRKFDFRNDNIRDTPAAIIFHGIVGQNSQERDSPSWFNPHEIWQVVFYMGKLYAAGLKNTDIGIVTPYAKQVQKLKHLLVSMNMSLPKIGSVEEFQGQERLAMIVSTVRSNRHLVKSDILHSLGFVASPQRLNVALTRARGLLIIIGNPMLLSNDPYWMNVVRYCVENKSYTGCDVNDLSGKWKIEKKESDEEVGEGVKEEVEEEEEEGEDGVGGEEKSREPVGGGDS